MKRVVFLLVSVVLAFGVVGQDKSKKIPPVVHSKVGQEFISNDNSLKITVLTKHQNHNWNDRTMNAIAESFNAKIKLFRANLRGGADKKFFLFRIAKLYGYPH